MRLLLLRDSKVGHANQVEAMAQSVQELVPADLTRIEVRRQRFASSRIRRAVIERRIGDPATWLKRLFGIDLDETGTPDIVLASCLLPCEAGLLIRRATGAKLILSGYPEGYDTAEMSLAIVHSPRFAGDPNCVFAPIPTTIDPHAMPPARRIDTIGDLAGARGSLFIGGPATGYDYAQDEWEALAGLIDRTGEKFGLRWRVTNSRRTPDAASRLFRSLAERGRIDEFIDFGKAGPGSAQHLLAADAIVVTEDSRSMMADALAAMRPVILMRPRDVQHSLGTERIAATVAGGGAMVLPIATASAEQLARSLVSIELPARTPRDIVTEAIAAVIGLVPADRSVVSAPSGAAR